MIKFKYIEDPFTDNMMYSFECFRYENLFYDILSKKLFGSSDAFSNLGYTFHMYMIVDECDKWLGYILFNNPDVINDYLEFIRKELSVLLNKLKKLEIDNVVLEQIDKMENNLNNYIYETMMSLPILQNDLDVLRDISSNSNLIDEYCANVCLYYDNYPEYYYMDVVIALPFNIDKRNIENNKQYFINETTIQLKKMVREKFDNIPIFIKKDNNKIYLFEEEKEENIGLLNKVKIKHNIR